ncbi:MAG: radical SAM protein [Pedobacter sp.]|uniref:B12-binding domain-containing radical SAM protein n=1 Tax=Pedobacter sp. TaxID=1411316 RepID=UPI0035635AAA
MKVLLVNTPPHDLDDIIKSKRSRATALRGKQIFPTGLLSIGAYLESKGVSPEYSDMWNMSWDEIRSTIQKINPDIIFSSCLTDNRLSSFKLASIAKQINPAIINVVGNAHATAMCEQILTHYSDVDFVVLGEGEETCLDLIHVLQNNGDISKVLGIAYRDSGNIHITDRRPLMNLDDIPYPTNTLRFDPDNPHDATIGTSRGCPYGCDYCSLSGFWEHKWRGKNPKLVEAEIQFLVSNGITHVTFVDDHFTFKKDRALEICKILKKYNISWSMQCRVDRIDRELLIACRDSNCRLIAFGVETLSPTILKSIHKQFTIEQIKDIFKTAHEVRIPVQANIIIGCPNETETTIKETIRNLNEIRPDAIGKFILMLYPDTPLYRRLKLYNQINDDIWLSPSPTPFYTIENDLSTLRKYSLQVQMQWFRQIGISRTIKELSSIMKEHGWQFGIDYILSGLSRIKIKKFRLSKNY